MRNGYINLAAGLVLAAVAGALVLIINELPDQYLWLGIDLRSVLVLAALAGIALAAYGARQKFAPPPTPERRASADAQLIFRSMIALAAADGDLHIDEVQMIQRCCAQFFKREMDYGDIRKAFDAHQRSNYGGFAFDGADNIASPEARAWAYKAAILVARADGDLTAAEQERLTLLATRLSLAEPAISQAREEAAQLYATLKSATA